MSQVYRQMEEDVAQKVLETMKLAETRRGALTQTEDATQGKAQDEQKKELEQAGDVSVRISERTENYNDKPIGVLKIGKDAAAKSLFLAKDIRIVADDRNRGLAEDDNVLRTTTFHLGFEQIRNVDKKQIPQTKQSTENELRDTSCLLDNRRELAEGALSLAQTAAWNIDNKFYDANDSDRITDLSLSLAQTSADDINNKLYVADVDKRGIADGALALAQCASYNIDNNRHETDDADKRSQTEGVANFKQLQIGDAGLQELADGALNLAQNAAWHIHNKLYDTDGGKREMAEGALYLAQKAVRDEVQTAGVNKREFAEGALSLAQHAARNIGDRSNEVAQARKRQLSREVGAFDDSVFKSVIDSESQQSQKLQLGFDQFAGKGELDEASRKALAVYDEVIVSSAETKIRQLSKELQNLETDNKYDTAEIEDTKKRELAEGALNLAKIGASNISDQYESGDVNIKELGEGALSLAQNGTKMLTKEVGSLDSVYFKTLTDQKPKLQLGFEQLENTFDSELKEAGQAKELQMLPGDVH